MGDAVTAPPSLFKFAKADLHLLSFCVVFGGPRAVASIEDTARFISRILQTGVSRFSRSLCPEPVDGIITTG